MSEPELRVGEAVQIDFRKWPDRKHWQYSMEYLGEDEHGRWLWAPAGTVAFRGEEGPIIFEHPRVKLISADWWAANFMVDSADIQALYIDVIHPAVWGDGAVCMIDLDLDVSAGFDGETRVLDEDEFVENQRLFDYPLELVAGARQAANRAYEAVLSKREPFGEVGWRWLTAAMARQDRVNALPHSPRS